MGTRQSRRLRSADGFAVNPQMTSPWTIEELDACFVLIDNGQHLPHA
jgi:hypothetical protein